jgi:hypothetical protein
LAISNETVTIVDNSGVSTVVIAGSTASSTGSQIMGTDGTNARIVLTDASGRLIVIGQGVAGTPAGGVVSIQGVAGGTAIPISGTVTSTVAAVGATGSAPPASAIYIGGNDGTNLVGLKLKPASTAAVAADPSLVVALSPNSALPTGANVIGAVTQSGTWSVTATQATAANLNALVVQGAAGTAAAAWFQMVTDGTNTAAVKAASTAAVAADPALVVAISPNNSITTTLADVTATGALGALNAAVQVNTAGLGTAGFQLAAGTLVGTILPEVSFDGGTTWNATYFDTAASGKVSTIVFGSSNTATAATIVGVGGSGLSRIRVSAFTSGTANITVRATTRSDPSVLFAGPAGVAPPPAIVYLGASDGTNLQSLRIKADSTAAVAADPALVVSLSPNSPVKATVKPLFGTNNQALTITIASLTNTSSRASTAIDNTTNLFEDVLIFVKITTAAAATSATGYVNIFGYGTVDGGTTYSESITGTNAAITLTNPPNLVLIAQVNTVANATTYRAGPYSFCRNYGLDRLPQHWGIVVQNESGATLNATAGNQAITYQGMNGQFA